MDSLENVKIKLELEGNDKDTLLSTLLLDSMNLINLYLGVKDFPTELSFIAEDITVEKYRRIGAEGISTEKIDALSTTYQSNKLLEKFLPYLKLYKDNINKTNRLRLL